MSRTTERHAAELAKRIVARSRELPASAFFAAGTVSQTLFLRGLFDKIHAVPQIAQRRDKSIVVAWV